MGEFWLEQPEFSWLKDVSLYESEAQCTVFKRTLNLGALGVKALLLHTIILFIVSYRNVSYFSFLAEANKAAFI